MKAAILTVAFLILWGAFVYVMTIGALPWETVGVLAIAVGCVAFATGLVRGSR